MNFWKDSAMTNEITVQANIDNIAVVTDFVEEKLEAFRCPMRIRIQLKVAIDELFGNIARYAYHPNQGPATVRVDVEKDPLRIILTFIDHGKPYDPLSTAEPDTTLPARQRQIGGLGVFMVRNTMDDISYEYRDGQNILSLKKNL